MDKFVAQVSVINPNNYNVKPLAVVVNKDRRPPFKTQKHEAAAASSKALYKK